MKRFLARVLAVVVVGASTLASAQLTLYGREDFRGRSLTIEQSLRDLQGTELNERASSARVASGSWQICSEAHFRGSCVTLGPGDYPTLAAIGLDNRISSVREIGWSGGGAPGTTRGLVLYEGFNQTGRSVRVDGTVESLGEFNDRARSVTIFEGEWELCQHDRFRGSCQTFGPGQHPNLGALSAEVSSVRPVAGPPGGGVPPPPGVPPGSGWEGGWGRGVRAILYEAPNFRGRSFVIADNVVADLGGTGFNDRAASLRVERGYWIFCSDAQFGGRCRTFGPGDYPTLPAELAHRISSGRRVHEQYPYEREPNWSR